MEAGRDFSKKGLRPMNTHLSVAITYFISNNR